MNKLRIRTSLLFIALMMTMLFIGSPATAATDPGLATAGSFGVLGATTVTNTGPTVINGDLGVSPGNAITGFDSPGGPGTVNPPGTIHNNDDVAAQAQSDLTAAYNNAAGQACDQVLTGTDLGGLTLVPGTYCFSSSAQLTGDLTLNVQGNPAAVFIFQIASTLTTASTSKVLFINGSTCNVYWQVGSSATLGTGTQFRGSILAFESITANTSATVEGRLLARGGAVTLDSNTVTRPSCAPAPTPTPTPDSTPDPTPSPSTPPPTVVGPDTVFPPGSVVSPDSLTFASPPGATGTTTSTPTSSPNPILQGQPVTLTTVVTSTGSGTPTGSVTFIDGSRVLGTVQVDGQGGATFTTTLTSGNHTITAVYQGSSTFAGSVSQKLMLAGSKTTAAPALPRTGINTLPLGLTAANFILFGAGLILIGRKQMQAT